MSKDQRPTELNRTSTWLLVLATKLWQRKARVALRELDLTPAQHGALFNLIDLGKKESYISQVRLAEALKSDVMTTSQIVRSLEKRKLVKRDTHPDDPRAYYLSITPEGKVVAWQALRILIRTKQEFVKAIENDEEELISILQRLIAANEE